MNKYKHHFQRFKGIFSVPVFVFSSYLLDQEKFRKEIVHFSPLIIIKDFLFYHLTIFLTFSFSPHLSFFVSAFSVHIVRFLQTLACGLIRLLGSFSFSPTCKTLQRKLLFTLSDCHEI